jgi:hypothetical protein
MPPLTFKNAVAGLSRSQLAAAIDNIEGINEYLGQAEAHRSMGVSCLEVVVSRNVEEHGHAGYPGAAANDEPSHELKEACEHIDNFAQRELERHQRAG